MLDLGTSFVASVARDPKAIAIVDGDLRLTYTEWFKKISALVAGLDTLGLKPGDHLVSVLQNRWEAATLHWACQFTGIILTPLNWRVKADELDFCLDNAEARALVYEGVAADAVAQSQRAGAVPRIATGGATKGAIDFAEIVGAGRCRGVVDHALHLRHDLAAEGRAAPAPRRARRRPRPRRAKSVRAG